VAGATVARMDTARRGSRRRDLLISSISMVLFLAAVVALIVASPGVNKVVESFFSAAGFEESFGTVAEGFWLNVKLMLLAEVLVLICGLGIAVVRSLQSPALLPFRIAAIIYTDVFRGIPLLLVIFIVGFGLPALQLAVISDQSVFTYGVIALTLVYSAYVAEVYRAGIDSVHPSQAASARSLGMTQWQAMRHVVLPQAVRRVIPPLLNDFIGLQKDTALISVLGLVEAARAAEQYASTTFNFTGYTMAALLFIAITIPLARVTDWLIDRDRRRMAATG
jgi:polar amino acid transport system permease protein